MQWLCIAPVGEWSSSQLWKISGHIAIMFKVTGSEVPEGNVFLFVEITADA